MRPSTNGCLRYLGGLLAIGLAGPEAWAISESLNLQLLPTTSSVNRMDIDLSATYSGFSFNDSELTRLSGNVLSDIEYDIVNGEPIISSIALTGGQVNVRGATSNNVTFSLGVIFVANVSITGTNIAGSLNTISPPSQVTNNQFLASDHQVTLNQGSLTADGSGLLSSVDETLDLAGDPLSLSQDTGFGTISLVQIGPQVGLEKTYEITVTLPVDDTEVIPIDNNGSEVPVTIDVSGSVIARDTFTVLVPLSGDYNDDGVVDAADYTVWRNSLGATGAGLAADGNGDLQVDGDDYLLWKSNFGESALGASSMALASGSVPEPGSLAILGLLAAGGVTLLRRRNKFA